jgi:hypothetical protein
MSDFNGLLVKRQDVPIAGTDHVFTIYGELILVWADCSCGWEGPTVFTFGSNRRLTRAIESHKRDVRSARVGKTNE